MAETPEARGRNVLLQVVPMPADSNANGDIFGGWALSQMDIAGAILAVEVSRGRVVTVAVDAMKFLKPVAIGDLMTIYGDVVKIGKTSIAVKLETYVRRRLDPRGEPIKVTEGIYTYVATDKDGNPRVFQKD